MKTIAIRTLSKRFLVGSLLACCGPLLYAASTDISDDPIANVPSGVVKPNVMFVLDDSGSMDSDFMPDTVNTGTIGYRSSGCNYVAYSPNIDYVIPPTSTGGVLNSSAQTSFTNAWDNGFQWASLAAISPTPTTFTNLTGRFYWIQNSPASLTSGTTLKPATGVCSLAAPAAGVTGVCYTTRGDKNYNLAGGSSSTSLLATPVCPAGQTLVWKKITVSSISGTLAGGLFADERQNYANWWTYYRKRLLMMKSATGRAFYNVPDSVRVGFTTINPNYNYAAVSQATVQPDRFLSVSDFDSTQRLDWYKQLYRVSTSGSTPLREALSRIGRYFAGKTDGINTPKAGFTIPDPVQHSCQRNYAILTTDGYWNGNEGRNLANVVFSTANVNQDGTLTEMDAYNSVGQQFAVSPRPMHDGKTAAYSYHTASNNYLAAFNTTACPAQYQIQYDTVVTTKTYTGAGQTGTQVGDPISAVTSGYHSGTCYATALAAAAAMPASGALTGAGPPTAPTGCASWPCQTFLAALAGNSDGLADVAQYYYKTDLRSGAMVRDVKHSDTADEADKASWQHMTTFTMGLGMSGNINYSPTYKVDTDIAGDFSKIRRGLLNWPAPVANAATALDDLWHAAVNGRGLYFSATDPTSVIAALSQTMLSINSAPGSGSAAGASNPVPVAGDNFIFASSYTSGKWTGDVKAFDINPATGNPFPTANWSAQSKLDGLTKSACDNRTIKLFRSGAANNLVDFKWNTYGCDASGLPTGTAVTTLASGATEQDFFDASHVLLLSHYVYMTDGTSSTVDQRGLAAGANMVNYLRGQRGKEGFTSTPVLTSNNANKLYRARDHVLGDIANSQAVYVKKPLFDYTDMGFATYKSNMATRTPMVYVGANDGMLHAFYAGTTSTDPLGGVEAWAFIPTMSLPNLYKLASEGYSGGHQYFVDGIPVAADVFDVSESIDCGLVAPASPELCWKTLIVGGMNKGGKGYYALDVTDPANPKALWEFKYSATCYDTSTASTIAATNGADCHIGSTFGTPSVVKLTDGTWVALVTSGYNNDDGQGYLYVLNAMTGKILYRISTGVGTAGSPSGLAQVTAWVGDALTSATADRVYGGDLFGNVWRFDVNDNFGSAGREATLLATLVDASVVPQPITTAPSLGEINGAPFVYVGTGRFLGVTDKPTTQTQTVWAIKDPMTNVSPSVSNLRSTLKPRILTNYDNSTPANLADDYRKLTDPDSSAAHCTSGLGWYIDLPDVGERVNIDMLIASTTLVFAGNVPTNAPCDAGGYGWINYADAVTGCEVAVVSPIAGVRYLTAVGGQALITGLSLLQTTTGTVKALVTGSDGSAPVTVSIPTTSAAAAGRRVSWREIVQ